MEEGKKDKNAEQRKEKGRDDKGGEKFQIRNDCSKKRVKRKE